MFQHTRRRGSSVLNPFVKGLRGYRARLQLEELEQRQLLSVAPAGSEFRVNTFTMGHQANPSIATDSAGDFVVAWESYGQDGDNWGVYAQRYNASGVVQGSEFQVNTYTISGQLRPSVAMDSAGDFVVTWDSRFQDGSSYGIFARRYNTAGVAQGGEFQVNTYTTGGQSTPEVAMDSAGDFVIAWNSDREDGDAYGVYAQRYDAAGVTQGSEFQVNTYTTNHQFNPSLAMTSVGDFVIAWISYDQDGSGTGVYAQRYNAAGVAQGIEFQVNTYTTGAQDSPSVAMNSAGDFVVAWQSSAQDGNGWGVYAQRYDASGVVQGSESQVNTNSSNGQVFPSVAMDPAGDFVIAWSSYLQDGSAYGVYAQRYSAAGAAQGSEFRVNTYTKQNQDNPSVAMDSAGDFVVAWQSNGQDGSGYGVYAQRYAVTTAAVAGRDLFYAGSGYDKTSATLPFSDDNAIAPDKSAYLPGSGAATFANVSSYSQGINGIMVDLATDGGSHTSITLAGILNDFTFNVGNNNSPGNWTAAPNPTTVLVRPGAGVAGSDRIELIWANGAITQKWLEVTVKATANTGLTANDVFFFGSEIGDTGASNTATIFKVSAVDTTSTQTHLATLGTNQPITNIYDFNRDGQAGTGDITLDQTHGTTNSTGLVVINIAGGGPFAPPPPGVGSASGAGAPGAPALGLQSVASAVTASASSQSPAPPTLPSWIANRLANLDLSHGPIAKYFEHLAHENTPKSRAILLKADQVADALDLDHALLDGVLAKLGLE